MCMYRCWTCGDDEQGDDNTGDGPGAAPTTPCEGLPVTRPPIAVQKREWRSSRAIVLAPVHSRVRPLGCVRVVGAAATKTIAPRSAVIALPLPPPSPSPSPSPLLPPVPAPAPARGRSITRRVNGMTESDWRPVLLAPPRFTLTPHGACVWLRLKKPNRIAHFK